MSGSVPSQTLPGTYIFVIQFGLHVIHESSTKSASMNCITGIMRFIFTSSLLLEKYHSYISEANFSETERQHDTDI